MTHLNCNLNGNGEALISKRKEIAKVMKGIGKDRKRIGKDRKRIGRDRNREKN